MRRRTPASSLLFVALIIALVASVGLGAQQPAQAAKSYQVVFKPNLGKGTMSSQLVPTTGKALAKAKFTRFDYIFAGWATSPTGKIRYANRAVIKPKAKTVLYARWAKLPATPALMGHKLGALLWSDEFSGPAKSQVSSANFTARYCGHDENNGGGTCHNSEPQWYTPDAIALDGSTQGNAVITTTHVTREPSNAGNCLAGECFFTSGRFDTQGKVSFKYGYLEARMKMPKGGGNWPAFWALGDSISNVGWPLSGEIDIAEQGGDRATRASSAVHYAVDGAPGCCDNHQYAVNELVGFANYQSDFHTYGLAWTPSRMEFYIDRELFWIVNPSTLNSNVWSFNQSVFLIFNNATGDFGGAYDGWAKSYTSIDYVRAYKLDGHGSVAQR